MSIESAVIHFINRLPDQTSIHQSLSDTQVKSSPLVQEMFIQFKTGFQKRNTRSFGLFNPSSSGEVASVFEQMTKNDADIIELSKALIEPLKLQLDQCSDGFSGHLLFVKEQTDMKTLLWLFWVEEKNQLVFNPNAMEPELVQVMDSSKLNLALKIDIEDWQDGSNKYIALLVPRGKNQLGQAFSDFIQFEQGIDQSKQTEEFLNVVDLYASTMEEPQAKEYKNKTLEYVIEQSDVGEPVVIEDLAKVVEVHAPEKFSEFVAEKFEQPTPEIQTDKASLKRYMRFSGRDDGMSISFDSDRLGEVIQYDQTSDELLFKAVPKSLKQQILKHLNANKEI